MQFWSEVNSCQHRGPDAHMYPFKTINILRGDTNGHSGSLDPLINQLTQPPAPAEPMKASDDTRVFNLGSCSYHSSLMVWEIKDHQIRVRDRPRSTSPTLAGLFSVITPPSHLFIPLEPSQRGPTS